jgi:hypothetical protein
MTCAALFGFAEIAITSCEVQFEAVLALERGITEGLFDTLAAAEVPEVVFTTILHNAVVASASVLVVVEGCGAGDREQWAQNAIACLRV